MTSKLLLKESMNKSTHIICRGTWKNFTLVWRRQQITKPRKEKHKIWFYCKKIIEDRDGLQMRGRAPSEHNSHPKVEWMSEWERLRERKSGCISVSIWHREFYRPARATSQRSISRPVPQAGGVIAIWSMRQDVKRMRTGRLQRAAAVSMRLTCRPGTHNLAADERITTILINARGTGSTRRRGVVCSTPACVLSAT